MATTVEAPVSTKTRGRILVVDDELVVRDSLGKWFTSEGYTARPASGAREALEVIQQAEFDIALIDIKMPGMDGMELQVRLREADPDLRLDLPNRSGGPSSLEPHPLKGRGLRLRGGAVVLPDGVIGRTRSVRRVRGVRAV